MVTHTGQCCPWAWGAGPVRHGFYQCLALGLAALPQPGPAEDCQAGPLTKSTAQARFFLAGTLLGLGRRPYLHLYVHLCFLTNVLRLNEWNINASLCRPFNNFTRI
ncbi:hypothetical protein AAC387_Pa06g3105 [Persea americana]